MTKTHKAVLSPLAVLCLLFMGSGVAQAQECFAFQSGANTVRAEGMTEAVGSIQLQCRDQGGFGVQPIGKEAVISITLNTAITNETNDAGDMVMGLTYTDTEGMVLTDGHGNLGEAADYMGEGKEVLSDGGTTITWTISTGVGTDDLFFPVAMMGSTVTIKGIMANASALGDGEDVTAEVRVNGVVIEHSPIKLADVTTGLDIKVTAASGLQCEAGMATATIMFTEGFNSAINAVADDALVLNFRGIPEGVTVTASLMGTGEAMEEDGTDLAPLNLVTGDDAGADADGVVSLSSAGAGEITYTFDMSTYDHDGDMSPDDVDARNGNGNGTAAMTAPVPQVDDATKEWNNVEITFTWKAGEPPVDMGTVTVSFHPVTDDMDERPRFASGPTNDVIEIEDCTTTLLFPYVTTKYGYDTGLVITNASEGSGSCTIGYSGPDAPEDMMTPEDIAGGEQWIGLLSTIAPGFQGYITATCAFRNSYGFAFITDAEATLAQGYLAVCTDCK